MAVDTRNAAEALRSVCAEVHDGGPDDAVAGTPVTLVARPATTDEVAEVVRAASAHRLTVVPRGRGTKMSWGAAPERADLVVDLSRCDAVLDHAAGDLIVHTQAGARLRDLQSVVGRGGQRLALDETVPGASVGGTLATNASGPRRVVAGTARDLLIGITVVRADGVVAKAGGRVVKNVAGYDLGKLMIGSWGTLAVITDATFRLHPVPEVERWVSAPVEDPAELHELTQAVVHSQTVPAAVDLDWPVGGPGTLVVTLAGRPDGVAARTETVRRLLGPSAWTDDQPPDGWAAYPWRAGQTGVKATTVLSGIGEVVSVLRSDGAAVRGSVGSGVLYASVEGSPPLDRWREVCSRHGGTVVVVDAPPLVRRSVDLWGPVPALELMRRVKDQFDPERRLAPGRFVGGI